MSAGVFLNDVDLEVDGWRLATDSGNPEAAGVDDAPVHKTPAQETAGGDGETELGTEPIVAARELRFPGLMQFTTEAALTAAVERLVYRCRQGDVDGLVRIRTARHLDREFVGRLVSSSVTWGVPVFGGTDATVVLVFRCPSPYAIAIGGSAGDRSVAFTTDTAAPVGSASVSPLVRITAGGGGCTNPEVVLKNAAGTEVARVTWDAAGGLSLAAGEILEANFATGITERVLSGVRTNAAKYRSDAGDALFALDPRLGDWLAGSPTFNSLSGELGSGSATFEAVYRERYVS